MTTPQNVDLTPTQNVHVQSITPLTAPRDLEQALPLSDASRRTVIQSRNTIKAILSGEDPRLLVVIGPCSIHDPDAALEYAERLLACRAAYTDRMVIVMRTYFEKPRTTVGWKGLINDPLLDGSFQMSEGLRIARKLLLDITAMGLPTATEFLDPFTPQYLDDMVSWAAIGARTTESQTHRQMASGLSMPVGYKNATDGNLQVAIDAMKSAKAPHHFLGVDEDGRCCVVATTGNRWGHVILRGGSGKTNYDPENVAEASQKLKAAGLPAGIMVDCSHANSGKKHEQQQVVWNSILQQRRQNDCPITGVMIESNLEPGRQDIPGDLTQLKRGVSVTDECIGWDMTAEMLEQGFKQLG
ncbi:Phospho-2-dehydro-3-deoxyheptonate aldolase, Tyr-sensitive [Mucisphaera calidilacus]|uniref:Phospho-2-dehydro-3-deoxyheptonate aldolase n=1 Tax=Mucisphaera calidilacus TaxID=2527982 RepID=A0A518C133_9BACT|nr:3-deoxy-7-phosphoheptulonate synthase [Mucisphaera calidilacus]QDU72904.1 Phospho-2-dehydro-3-deoxyheptonate aldolase, Tyr-sensitive [Mucisphaera calidilacus]